MNINRLVQKCNFISTCKFCKPIMKNIPFLLLSFALFSFSQNCSDYLLSDTSLYFHHIKINPEITNASFKRIYIYYEFSEGASTGDRYYEIIIMKENEINFQIFCRGTESFNKMNYQSTVYLNQIDLDNFIKYVNSFNLKQKSEGMLKPEGSGSTYFIFSAKTNLTNVTGGTYYSTNDVVTDSINEIDNKCQRQFYSSISGDFLTIANKIESYFPEKDSVLNKLSKTE